MFIDNYQTSSVRKHATKCFLGIVALLMCWGIASVYSASAVYAFAMHHDTLYYVKSYLVALAIGTILVIISLFFTVDDLYELTPFGYVLSIGITAFTLIPYCARTIHGSSRWLKIGIALQPSELMVVMCIAMTAYILTKIGHDRHNTQWPMLIAPLSIIIIPVFLLLKQPDFGMAAVLTITVCCMIYSAGISLRYLGILAFSGISFFSVLLFTRAFRLQRLLTFLNPWQDPHASGFQIIQSFIAIARGGLWGVGFGNSEQKLFHLPMQHTDFIVSIIAEELGFVGIVLLLIIIALFIHYGFSIASKSPHPFIRHAGIGFMTVTALRMLLHMAVCLGCVPTKGVPFPFMSYANSNLIAQLIMVGLLIRIQKKRSEISYPHYSKI